MPSALPDTSGSSLAVAAIAAEFEESARALAAELELIYLADTSDADCRALLELGADGLHCRPLGEGSSGPVRVDFAAGGMRHRRRGGHNEPLGRAVGVGKRESLWVVDATAGLGRDSFVLADLGCRVTLLERAAVAFALLRDGLVRAQCSEDTWLRDVSARMSLQRVDARDWLAEHAGGPDVVYLDPMFPERKKSARVKKEMWLFHQLIGVDSTESELLAAALAAAQWRVVVKRPSRAPHLSDREPHHLIPGKTVRFDVYNADGVS